MRPNAAADRLGDAPVATDPATVLVWARGRPEWFGSRVEAVLPGGRGESFAVWRVRTADGEYGLHLPLDPSVPPRVPALMAALRSAPDGVGPRAVGSDDAGRYVTTWVPGSVRPPDAWGKTELAGLARVLARLHAARRTAQPGPVAVGPASGCSPNQAAQSPAEPPVSTTRLAAELTSALDDWRTREPRALDPAARRLAARLQERLAAIDAVAPPPPCAALCHGDPVAGNVVWPPGSADPVLIDWEWARFGDPARDLGLIGGAIAADPWYAALSRDQVRGFVAGYLQAGGSGDLDALVTRRDGWLLLATFTDCLYLRSRELAGTATEDGRTSRRALLAGLSAELLP